MSETTITIVSIFLAAILMFVFPLVTLADRNDDVAKAAVQTATIDFVDSVTTKGKITLNDYDNFKTTLASTGNTYDVEIELQILDENPGKKVSQGSSTVIGENVYYSMYTTQVLDAMGKNVSKEYKLKEGDIVNVKVKNTNTTLSQTMKNFWYKVTGNDTYIIYGSWSGVVAVNGK